MNRNIFMFLLVLIDWEIIKKTIENSVEKKFSKFFFENLFFKASFFFIEDFSFEVFIH